MTAYAAKIRLRPRFEDYGDEPPVDTYAGLEIQGGEKRIPPNSLGAEGFGGGGIDTSGFTITQDIIPLGFTVELNSHRQADTARVHFNFEQFPVDPRALRSCAIQIFAGVVSSVDFALANQGRGSTGYLLPDIVPPGYPGAGKSWELFRGFVDEAELDCDTGIVSLVCRDTTSIFIDCKIPDNLLKDIPKSTTIDDIVRKMIADFPGARGTVVVVEASRPMPTLNDFAPPNWFDSKGNLRKGKRKKAKDPKEISFWDMITDLVVAAGLSPSVRLPQNVATIPGIGSVLPAAEIVITDPQTYYQGSSTLGLRHFMQGLNCSGMVMKRTFGGTPVPFIEVRSWDPVAGVSVSGYYPPKPKKSDKKRNSNKSTPTGVGDRAEYHVYTVDNLRGPQAPILAARIARSIYEELGRGEMSVRFETAQPSAIPANVNDERAADMLLMRPSETILVDFMPARGETVSSDGEVAAASVGSLAQRMVNRGLNAAFAARAAKAMKDPRLQKEFRVGSIVVDFDGNGCHFQVEAKNFLDARFLP